MPNYYSQYLKISNKNGLFAQSLDLIQAENQLY